jgi:hypothetical protein
VHDDNEIDWLSISAVERILGEAAVDMADLIEAPIADGAARGAA